MLLSPHYVLAQAIKRALSACFGLEVKVDQLRIQPIRKGFEGSHTWLAFSLAEETKCSPSVLAQKIGAWLEQQESEWIEACQAVGGFLNLTLCSAYCLAYFNKQLQENDGVKHPKHILMEIAAPNTNKPLHLGHLRNTFIGDAVARLLEKIGHKVVRMIHINDRGVHICKSMYAYLQDPKKSTPEATGIKGDHYVGKYYVAFAQQLKAEEKLLDQREEQQKQVNQPPSLHAVQEMLQAWEDGNPEVRALWQQMNHWVYEGFEATFKAFGLHFDAYYYESKTYLEGKKMVQEGLKKGFFYQKEDQSIWVDLSKQGLGDKLLLRGDGTSVYMTQDIGTAEIRDQDYHPDQVIYVVGNEQDYHFNQLFAILKKMKRDYASHLYHLSYGMVDLPSGKMKSREGTVVDADDLLKTLMSIAQTQTEALGKPLAEEEAEQLYHQLALGAVKYFLLKVHPKKRILFDPQQSIDFQGHTGTFIQYTHARIATLLRKHGKSTLTPKDEMLAQDLSLTPIEKECLLLLGAFSSFVHRAAEAYNPAIITQYIYDLAKLYNKLYAQLPIAHAEEAALRERRLLLSYHTALRLREGADLLGFVLPERM